MTTWHVPRATLYADQADWLLWHAGAQGGGHLPDAMQATPQPEHADGLFCMQAPPQAAMSRPFLVRSGSAPARVLQAQMIWGSLLQMPPAQSMALLGRRTAASCR